MADALLTDAPIEHVVLQPTWDGDKLSLPSTVQVADIPAARAYECWHQVYEIAARYPKTALALGAPIASLLLERWQLPGGGVNLLGDSTTSKTTMGRVGSAQLDKPLPAGNDPSWSGTLGSKTAELADSGGMPLFWDDAHNTMQDEQTLRQLVMQVAQGREKGRLNQHATQRDKRSWRLVVVSTSELSLLDGGTVGAAARWTELQGPFLPDVDTAELVDDLAREAYGWVGRRLTEGDWELPKLPVLRRTDSAVANRASKLIAAYAAGFAEVARMFGVTVDAQAFGQAVLDEIAEALTQRGDTSSQRLKAAIDEHIIQTPGAYPEYWDGKLIGLHSLRDLCGLKVPEEGRLYVFASHVATLAKTLKLDRTAALQGLKGSGELEVWTPGNGLQERTPRVNGRQIAAYVFDLPECSGLHSAPADAMREFEDLVGSAAEGTKVAA